jgi:hypothetical protein
MCPAQIILEKAHQNAQTKLEMSAINGLADAVRRQSRAPASQCSGADLTELGHGTELHCGNSNLEVMRHVYDMQREARGLTDDLPESIASIVRNE